jgi:hypothetical protein
MIDAKALNLLARGAGIKHEKLPSEAGDLIAECGSLPLAVAPRDPVRQGVLSRRRPDRIIKHDIACRMRTSNETAKSPF